MEKNSEEKKLILPIIIVGVVAFLLGSSVTYMVMRGAKNGTTNDVTGTWYSTYAGQTFLLALKKDKTFEYGYEGQDMTKGKYTNTNEIINLITDSGSDKLIYEKGTNYIEISSTRYYNSKDEAAKNDEYYYVPDDYDTSMFTKISAKDFIQKFNDGETAFVLTARGSCGYCQQFRPVAAESVKKYDYTLYYLDTTTLTDEDYTKIRALDEKLEDFGSTPNVYYFKGKAIVDIQAGAADEETYGSFLTKNGVKTK